MSDATESLSTLIWQEIDAHRDRFDRGTFIPDRLCELLARHGRKILPIELQALRNTDDPRHGPWLGPTDRLLDFLVALSTRTRPHQIVDPWCNAGILVGEIAQRVPGAVARGVCVNAGLRQLLDHVDAPVTWSLGRAEEDPSLAGADNDLVVCTPPFGLKSTRSGDDVASTLLELSGRSLTPGGRAIFVLSPAGWFAPGPAAWRTSLSANGLAVRACFAVPAGVWAPHTGIRSLVVELIRGAQQDLFVAELPSTAEQRALILSNLDHGVQADDARFGRWLPIDEFTTMTALLATEQLARVGVSFGAGHRLGDVASVIPATRRGAAPAPGAIRLPLSGNVRAPAVLATDEKLPSRRPEAYVAFRDDIALPEFAVRYFSTEPGRVAREMAVVDPDTSRLSIAALADAPVFLPPLDVQRQIVELGTSLQSRASALNEAQERLWARPLEWRLVAASVPARAGSDAHAAWVDTLPFPVASVLWHEQGVRGAKDKVTQLLRFFEAYAAYWATSLPSVLLAGAPPDAPIWAKLRALLGKPHADLDRPSFGLWNMLVEHLVKAARAEGSDEDGGAASGEALPRDPAFLQMFLSTELPPLLRAVGTLRNEWRGHGGLASDAVEDDRLVTLHGHLAALRSLVGERWAAFPLLRVGKAAFTGGIFDTDVEELSGTRLPFPARTERLRTPSAVGGLYLAARGGGEAVPLLPLIRMAPSLRNGTEACFFYTRATRDEVCFVCHHAAEVSEWRGPFEDTARLLGALRGSRGQAAGGAAGAGRR